MRFTVLDAVPRGFVLKKMTEDGSVLKWASPDGRDLVFTFKGRLHDRVADYAERRGISFEEAARQLIGGGLAVAAIIFNGEGDPDCIGQN